MSVNRKPILVLKSCVLHQLQRCGVSILTALGFKVGTSLSEKTDDSGQQ